ncbi:hypothetical protein B0F90DRAFT_1720731 [Multifurca ochricompacta]|uniref:Csf1 N-terminal domain-containing protein n=1 Tax=Multifurca ochricompacta TaxID=376703 RepID=A0AAD4M5Y2_9AGAM|nr:hypothetical protein B0F90DRAFT_1720731 [Multifurca ochricompacta]
MVSTGSHIHDHLRKAHSLGFHYFHYLTYSVFSKIYRSARLRDGLHAAAQIFRKRPTTSSKTFRQRLKRAQSVDMETPVGPDSAKREYAIERKFGIVPVEQRTVDREGFDVGNGDTSPEWGLDLVVHGGLLRYGPWADRQRAELQRVFFPPTYHDVEETLSLLPGENRIWTAMRSSLSFNWQWDGYVNVPRPRTREAASLSIKAGDDSTISYLMPMVADAQGYHTLLEVHLDSVTISSSLNDIQVLTTESCRISGEMPSPLKWDANRQWTYNVSLRRPTFYILRDHVNMLTDLGKDWSSGPPSNYFTWIPMRYTVNLELRNYEINTYVNDHNIIDKPLLWEENALLTLRGASFRNENVIMSDKFRPAWTSFPFSINAPDVILSLTLPKWSTHRLQTMEPITKLMTVGLLRLDGSYLYFSDVREENIDQLTLKFTLNDVRFKCLAWSIRHFMIFQQNYFGTFTHFSTLREYLQKREQGQVGDPIDMKHRPGASNSMQVEVRLSINHSIVILPVGLPGYETYCPLPGQSPEDVGLGGCVVLSVPEIQLQLRSHNLGLQMDLNIDTIYGDVESDYTEGSIFTRSQWYPSTEVFLIEGIDILADRLFGPQPHALAYVCFWEISLGSMKGLLSASHSRTLQSALNAFIINYKDPMNAPAAEFALPLDPDVTLLKVTLASIDMTWSAGQVSVHCHLPQGLCIASNDLAGNNHRRVTSVSVPRVIIRFLHALGERNDWVEAGEVVFDIALDNYSSPPGWQEGALSQAKFLAEQDEPTGRLRKLKIGLEKRGRWMPSRSMYTAILRLPRPYLDQYSASNRQVPLPGDWPQGTDLTKPIPFSHRHIYSDSDDEGPYTVIDHDARLVNSRPPSMLPLVHADDESMSSADESDDGDLTDGSSYGSEVSEWNEGDSAASENSLAFLYSRVSRHYSLPTAKPSLWVDTPVVILRDRRAPAGPAARPAIWSEGTQSGYFRQWKADITDEGVDKSTTRVLTRSVEAWVTPLLPSVIIHLLEDNSRAAMSPEQRIDSLVTSHIRDLLSEPDAVKMLILDVQISSFRLQVVQLVHKPHNQHDGLLHAPDSTYHPLQDEIAVVDIQLFDLGLKGQAHKEEKQPRQSFALSMNHFGLTLDLHDMHRSPHRPGLRTVVQASLSGVTSGLVHKRADLVWRALSVTLETDATDYISEVASAHVSPITWATNEYHRLQARVLAGARVRVHQILQWSKELSVVDPLSTIQPSYLVQTGRPHEIRVHPASKILLYIRSCLRFLAAEEREAVRNLTGREDTVVTREEVIALLEGQLAGLAVDADTASLQNLNLITRIFGAPDSPRMVTTHERPIQTVGIDLQSIKISVLHPTQGAPSEIQLRMINITVALKRSELLLGSAKLQKDFVSARDKQRSVVQRVAVSIVLDDVKFLMLPHILNFAQSLVRVRKRTENASPSSPSIPLSHPSQSPWKTSFLVDAALSLHTLRFQVAAENLIVAFNASHLGVVSSVYIRPHLNSQGRPDLSANLSLFFDLAALEAHSSADKCNPVPQDMLAEISVKKTRLNCAFRYEVSLNPTIRAALVVGCLQLSVPRSAILLSRFIDEWKADYLPGFEQTIQALVSELRQAPTAHQSPTNVQQRKVPSANFRLSIGSCGVFLHVLPGTWLSWEVMDILAYVRIGVDLVNSRRLSASFGLRFSLQRISIASLPKGERLEDALKEKGRLKVDLPSTTVTGTYENHGVHILVSAGFFFITVKPSYWDTLLSVQQKFENDINDLLHVLADARARQPPSQTPAMSPPSSARLSLQSGTLKAKGFRIGLEGHSSTLFFECQDIAGGLKGRESKGKGKFWHLNVTGLALSLVPRARAVVKSVEFDRNRRSAFVVIDCKVEVDRRTAQKFLKIKMCKINAVMQPSSIGEIGDFVDHLQAEVLGRKDERVRELAAFKEKTQSIMAAFEVHDRESDPSDVVVWFKDYAIVFSVSNVGVAFPLALDNRIELPLENHISTQPSRPSSFPLKLQFIMRGFSFQFVDRSVAQPLVRHDETKDNLLSRFRQSVPDDFAGDGHFTRNRLIYPDMTAQVRTERSAKSRRIRVGASISGFILDLEPSIADHVASLVDVYKRGKERMDRFTVNAPHNAQVQELKPNLRKVASGPGEATPPTSSILLSLVFLSGQVHMHSGPSSYSPRVGSLYESKGNPPPVSAIESFSLPMLSVWGEYRATPAPRRLTTNKDAESSSLILKSTIHSSENTLRPSLLPFITDLVNHVERRMRKANSSSSSFSTRSAVTSASPELTPSHDDPPASSMQITFALRIDQSRLQLTCQPDVNVIAGVDWDSGGFLLNVSRSGGRISFIGNVGGLSIGLKHGFLSEDCVRLDARNLAFSTTFTGADKAFGLDVSSMSVVVDTEVSGGLHFSRFQDVLCFKAVWLDRIPVLSATPLSEPADNPLKTTPMPGSAQPKNGLTTAVLVRLRRVGLNVDLGQSISSVRMDMLDVTLRSKIEEMCAELSVSIGTLTLSASGNISGRAHIPDFSFHTMRRKALVLDPSDLLGEPRMLDMSLRSGSLEMTLESDYQRILQLWSEPLSITVWDDWSQMSPQVAVLDRLLRLSFAVSGTELIAVGSVSTIPKLVSYGSRFKANLQAQREGAARESRAFRIAQSPKPDNPLSAFANAMLQTARTRLREKEDSLSYVVQQRMQFSLGSLKLVVFPRTMVDSEMASFSASNLRADLDLIVEFSDLPVKRKLHLAFAGMSASRVGPLNHGAIPEDVRTDVRRWLDTLRKGMPSEEANGVLEYDFVSQFARGDMTAVRREDIYITLNMALRTITESSPPDIASLSLSTPPIDRLVLPRPPRGLTRSDAATERRHKPTFSMSAMPSRSDTSDTHALGPPVELLSPSRGTPAPLLGIQVTGLPSTNTQTLPSPVAPAPSSSGQSQGLAYQPRHRRIERLHMRQLGEATPDVMHPFFTKRAGFSLEDALPQYVHEYATVSIEEITRALLKLYSRQLSGSAPR